MNQNLARYHARAPRYILNTKDNELIRVAGPKQTPWEENTEIKNVSLTGLAFIAPEDLSPRLGEVIKIQFVVPGGKQMACFAIVTRIEPDKPEQVLVGVHFYKLEMSHRIVLAQGLSQRLRTDSNQNLEENTITSLGSFGGRIVFLSFVLSLWVWFMLSFIHFGYSGFFQILEGIFSSFIVQV